MQFTSSFLTLLATVGISAVSATPVNGADPSLSARDGSFCSVMPGRPGGPCPASTALTFAHARCYDHSAAGFCCSVNTTIAACAGAATAGCELGFGTASLEIC
ncbi:hypothetical protein B0H16DRAFT_1520303 [Mycena metata]|uniref:Uncharacterized protein n=1 Tax=Mycena metata TaxID=1033252 RepID=A0AAD7JLW5_9AGAR|nr:hypothetical protein B0H16DRAFT_1520303 [Mycena metata]